MNARACERVTEFFVKLQAKKFNYLCAQRHNYKTINYLDKIKLLLNLKKEYTVNKNIKVAA